MIEQIMKLVVDAADEKKAHNIVTLDLRGVSLVSDYFVICHGNSDTQVKSIVTEIKKKAEEHGVMIKGIEGSDQAKWVLIDMGDVVAHVFHRDERDYYHLEKLWSDALLVEHA